MLLYIITDPPIRTGEVKIIILDGRSAHQRPHNAFLNGLEHFVLLVLNKLKFDILILISPRTTKFYETFQSQPSLTRIKGVFSIIGRTKSVSVKNSGMLSNLTFVLL